MPVFLLRLLPPLLVLLLLPPMLLLLLLLPARAVAQLRLVQGLQRRAL